MAVCRATKRDGTPCTLPAAGPDGLCWAHDPANRERRRKLASHAAKSKRDTPRKQIQQISQNLADLYASVLSGGVQPKVAAVAAQVANAQIRALDTERRIVEQEEIITRLEQLEQRYNSGGVRSWG
jgi:hypothetical protein